MFKPIQICAHAVRFFPLIQQSVWGLRLGMACGAFIYSWETPTPDTFRKLLMLLKATKFASSNEAIGIGWPNACVCAFVLSRH